MRLKFNAKKNIPGKKHKILPRILPNDTANIHRVKTKLGYFYTLHHFSGLYVNYYTNFLAIELLIILRWLALHRD